MGRLGKDCWAEAKPPVRRDGPKEDPTHRPAAPVTELLINSLLVTPPLFLPLSFLCLIEISSFQNEFMK
jgi:hypothetical protein